MQVETCIRHSEEMTRSKIEFWGPSADKAQRVDEIVKGEIEGEKRARNKYFDYIHERFEEEEDKCAVTQLKRKLRMSIERKGREFLEEESNQVTRRRHRQGR